MTASVSSVDEEADRSVKRDHAAGCTGEVGRRTPGCKYRLPAGSGFWIIAALRDPVAVVFALDGEGDGLCTVGTGGACAAALPAIRPL